MLVRYRVHAGHKTDTVKGEATLQGSIHHPEMTEFTGLVTRDHGDGTHDLVIFPPNKPPVHLDAVKEGAGDHEFLFHGKKYPKADAAE